MAGFKLVRGVFVIAALGGLFMAGSQLEKKNIEEANATFGLDAKAQEVAGMCRRSMDVHEQEFTNGLSEIDGCACMAGEMTASSNADAKAMGNAINYLIKAAADDSELNEAVLARQANVDETEAVMLMMSFGLGLSSCSDYASAN